MNICLIDTYHEFHFEVLEKLKTKNPKINYSYTISGTNKNFHGNVRRIAELKKTVFNNSSDVTEIINFIFPSKIIGLTKEKWTINEKIINELKNAETYFLRLTDRSTAFPISVHERRQYYLILLNYFNSILIEKKFDYLITFDTPHSFPSYLLYQLHIYYKIPVIRLEQHFLQNHSLILSNEVPHISEDYYNDLPIDTLYQKLTNALKRDLKIYNNIISSSNKKERSAIIGKTKLSGIRLIYRYIIKALMNITMGTFPFLFKKEILHFTALNEINSSFFYRLRINKPLWKLINYNRYYNKLSITPDLSAKYIFFGMHMQPEKTSQPLGGEYDNQLMPIIILSKSLPKNWFLYVKEHPNQFNKRKITNANYRNKYFYDTLSKLDNVKLVSLQVSSSELIENAKIVSTLTGTLGWEGLMKKKPVIAFGYSYYKACRAVRSPKSVEECKQSINELITLSKDDITKEIYRYLLFYSEKKYLVETSNSESAFNYSTLTRDEQINNLVDSIQKKLVFSAGT